MNKKNLIFVLPLLLMSWIVQGQVGISTPETVALQAQWGSTRPRIVLDAASNPVVIWSNPTTKNVYVSRKSDDTFQSPVKLNPDGMELSIFDWSGPEIASSGNNIFVVFKQIPEHSSPIFCVKSSDGGTTWSDTVRVDSSTPMISRMPAIGIDNAGNPIIAFLRENMDNGYSDWAVARSLDGGASFEPAFSVTTATGGAVCDCCPAAVETSGDNIAVLYRNNDVNLRDIRASISHDGGATFDTNIDMDNLDWMVNVCPSSGPSAFFAGTELKSAWMSKASGYYRVYYSSADIQTSTSNGSMLIHDAPTTQIQNRPAIAGNESEAGVVAEFSQTGQNEIFFSWSSTDFSEGNFISVTQNLSGNQLRPDLAFDGVKYHLVFTDNGIGGVTYLQLEVGGVAVLDVEKNEDFQLMPNPANNELRLQVGRSHSPETTISLIDLSGRIVFVERLGSSPVKTITTKQLSDGFYSCVIIDRENILANIKVVIQH